MIHEIRTYSLVPGGVREYLRIYNELGREVQTQLLGNLVALMTPETGDLNQLVPLELRQPRKSVSPPQRAAGRCALHRIPQAGAPPVGAAGQPPAEPA